MSDYAYREDGRIHTRYSTLIRCTPGQIDRVIAEMHGASRVETEHMSFGTLRHEMLEEEARATGRIPTCFGVKAAADFIEHEFTTELIKGVVVHSRPDAVSAQQQTVWDYKTVVDGKNGWQENLKGYGWRPKYNAQRELVDHTVVPSTKQHQLQFYAYQMGLHGIRITKGTFLCEIWNRERDEILGYEVIEFPITFRNMASIVLWVKGRVALLQTVMAEVPA